MMPYATASLEALTRAAANAFEAHTVALFLADDSADALHLAAFESLSNNIVPDCVIRPGQGLVGWVFREDRVLHAVHFQRDTKTLGIFDRDVGIRAFLACPLPERSGVLMAASKNRYAFPDKCQKIIKDFAALAAELWKTERRAMELRHLRGLVENFERLHGDYEAALQGLAGIAGLNEGLLAVRDTPEAGYFSIRCSIVRHRGIIRKKFPVDQGLAGWVLRHRQNIVLTRFEHEERRSFILWPEEPVRTGPSVLGLFSECGGRAWAWILSGANSLAGWPKGLDRILSEILSRRKC